MTINPKGVWDEWAIDNQDTGGKYFKGDVVKYIGVMEEFRGRIYKVTGSNFVEMGEYGGAKYEYSLDNDHPYLVWEYEIERVEDE